MKKLYKRELADSSCNKIFSKCYILNLIPPVRADEYAGKKNLSALTTILQTITIPGCSETRAINITPAFICFAGKRPALLFPALRGGERFVEQYCFLQHPGQRWFYVVWHQGWSQPLRWLSL